MKFRAALCLILTLALCGCAAPSNVQTESVLPGYRSAGDIAYGGSAQGAGDLNAKSLSIQTQANGEKAETVLTFSFVSGSRMSGGVEEQAGCGVPVYSVYTLDNPARLVVEFENLAHWDYRHGLELTSPLLRGTFQHSLFGSPRVSLYFQLSQPALFTTAEEGDTLSIHLLPKNRQEQTSYFVTANAYSGYCSGTISAEFNISPTLASDLQNVLLISPAMQTEAQADAYLADALRLYPSIPAEQWQVVTLTGDELPAYDSTLNYLAALNTPAVRLLSGSEITLPTLVPDGLYLCDLPNGAGFLFSRELPSESGTNEYQQLYMMRQDGQTALATAFEFSAIEKAQYSPDSRKLAVLERTSGSTHLYVFDADTYELLNDLSEMGFGGNTSTFIWNSLGNTIYAITGVSGVELHQFDYSIPDEASRHSVVDRNSVDEGSLGYCDGELYFSHATMEEGSVVYHIKPEGGIRKPFTDGSRFVISEDARYMAVVRSSENTGTATSKNSLILYELATGGTRLITDKFYPYDCIWSQDCTKLYYIESRISGGQTEDDTSAAQTEGADNTADGATADPADTEAEGSAPETAEGIVSDPYPYTLWVYDVAMGTSERLLDLSAPNVFAGNNADILYLNRYETDEFGTRMRASYLLDLNAVFAEEAERPTGDTMDVQ